MSQQKIFIYLLVFQNLRSLFTKTILFLKRKSFLRDLYDHKSQKLDVEDINRKIKILTKLIKTKNNVNASKLGKDLIFISSKGNS